MKNKEEKMKNKIEEKRKKEKIFKKKHKNKRIPKPAVELSNEPQKKHENNPPPMGEESQKSEA